MRLPEVRPYYEILQKRKLSLLIKRVFDFVAALILVIVLALPMTVIAVMVKRDSKGPVFYRQNRLGQGGGYYDRYLTRCPGAKHIAVAFAEQELQEIAMEPKDRKIADRVTA